MIGIGADLKLLMAKDYKMTQCFMMDQFHHTYIAWIPSKHANVGQKIHFSKYYPESTWTIQETYGTKDYSLLNEQAHDYKDAFPSLENQ